MRKIVWIGCLSYLLIGLAHVVLGAVLEPLIAHYGLSYSSGSQLIFNQFAGFLAGVLCTPLISGWLGRRGSLIVALICLTLAETVYSFLPSWSWMLAAGPVAGFGFGIVEAAIGALIIEFVVNKKAVAVSRLEVFFGVGALLMPAIAGYLIHQGLWQWSFPFVAITSLITLLIWVMLPFGQAAGKLLSVEVPPDVPDIKAKYDRKTIPLLIFMMAFFLLYVGVEMSLVHFLPTIIMDIAGASPSTATASITIFWIAMVVGRIFAGNLAEWAGYPRYLTVSTLGTFLFLVIFSSTTQLWSSFGMILLLGLSLSGIFAIGLIFANERIPGMTARTTSLVVASGGIGGAFVPRLIGWTMDKYSLQTTQWVLIVVSGLLLIIIAIVSLTRKYHDLIDVH